MQKDEKKVSKSVRIKRYGSVYNQVLQDLSTISIHPKKPEKTQKKSHLNSYQEFVRVQSKQSKYKNMSASDRLKSIGKEWRKKTKCDIKT